MTISFRPDKKFLAFFESMNEKGEKSRFLNHAVGFTLSFQSVMEKQLETMQLLLEQHQDITAELQKLRHEVAELKRHGIHLQKNTRTDEGKQDDKDSVFSEFLISSLGDISL